VSLSCHCENGVGAKGGVAVAADRNRCSRQFQHRLNRSHKPYVCPKNRFVLERDGGGDGDELAAVLGGLDLCKSIPTGALAGVVAHEARCS